jgi:Zn2+/Cd2+-exporting ATPase
MASISIDRNSPTTRNEGPEQAKHISLEVVLVIVTGLALAASFITERTSGTAWLVTLFNVIAYGAGGYSGTIASLESLKIIKTEENKDESPQLDVDTLMILAAIGAALVNQWHEGAMLLFLFSLSNVLQDFAIGRSRQAIRSLMKLYPSEVRVLRNGERQTISLEDIRLGEIVLIEPGERIPVDGTVRNGHSAVDQSPITGESMPVDKVVNDKVFAGTLNVQGALDVEATQQAKDTVLARIIQMVEQAQESKAPTERFLEKFEQRYALFIIVGVALFIVIPPALGWVDFSSNFYRAMVIMTVAAPCALVISTPASFLSAIASAARGGVLFKGGAYIENLATLKAIAFDKTGTLTTGKPIVTDLVPFEGVSESELLRVAASAEDRSQHPVAKAIVNAARERQIELSQVNDFESIAGRGIEVEVAGKQVKIGSPTFMGDFPAHLESELNRLEGEGKTVMGVQQEGKWLGLIAVMDGLRPTAKQLVSDLHNAGIKVVMLTGDNPKVAQTIAAQTGVDAVYAELMPADKARIIAEVRAKYGATGMVGDGVNDAPALATADIGLAMGAAGTDVALETADVVLMGDRLELIPFAINLSQKARRVVWQNITFALAVIVVLLISAFLISLPLPLGVLGHEGSTVIVVLNGLIQLLILPEIMRQRSKRRLAKA